MNLDISQRAYWGIKQDGSASGGAACFHVLRLSESATGTSTYI